MSAQHRGKVRRFIRFAGFETEGEVHDYCKREGITVYKVWTGEDGIVRGSGELPDGNPKRAEENC
jgi:hypothetical protein